MNGTPIAWETLVSFVLVMALLCVLFLPYIARWYNNGNSCDELEAELARLRRENDELRRKNQEKYQKGILVKTDKSKTS